MRILLGIFVVALVPLVALAAGEKKLGKPLTLKDKTRISDLANEEAHAGDDRQALIDITASMIECADLRQDFIDHLWEKQKYTVSSLKGREASITKFCNDVKKSYKAVVKGS